ncbi:3-deoxy-manno-octulosonate cytidylyltransferase [bacterium]|nr:3-deoxy-manno-octulosonate cytidylyltransferase [bacterium]MCP5462596.1 3-deoxy-manno-octulosonate cytidylyltransferase [bacterium]
MRVCAIIPARYASVRLPAKPLADIKGKPMVQHVYERACRAKLVDKVIVATDDNRIADAVLSFGGDAVLTSPEHSTGTDRIAEAASLFDCEYALNVQGDEPLIEPALIDKMVEALLHDSSVVMATPITPMKNPHEIENPNVVKVVTDLNGNAIYFSRSPIPFVRDKSEENTIQMYKHIGLYGYRKDFLLQLVKWPQSSLEKAEKLEQLRVLENGYPIKTVVGDYDGISVDTPNDLMEVLKRI